MRAWGRHLILPLWFLLLPVLAGQRVWTDTNGKTTTAELHFADDKTVGLKRGEFTKPMDIRRLSQADRNYVAAWRAKYPNRTPEAYENDFFFDSEELALPDWFGFWFERLPEPLRGPWPAVVCGVCGLLLLLFTTLQLFRIAFGTSFWWGLAYMLLPFGNLIFVLTHWKDAGRTFRQRLLSFPLLFLGIAFWPPV